MIVQFYNRFGEKPTIASSDVCEDHIWDSFIKVQTSLSLKKKHIKANKAFGHSMEKLTQKKSFSIMKLLKFLWDGNCSWPYCDPVALLRS